MKVLHILNDGPSDDAQFIIEQQSSQHDLKIIDLSRDEIDYEEVVDQIERSDQVFSW